MKKQSLLLGMTFLMLISAGIPAHPVKASVSKTRLSELKAQVRTHPANRSEREQLAQAYEAAGNKAKALYHYKKLLGTMGQKERNDTAERDLLLRSTSHLYLELNQPGKAIPLLQSALAIHPWDTGLRDSLRHAYLATGQRQQAEQLLREGRDYYLSQRVKPG